LVPKFYIGARIFQSYKGSLWNWRTDVHGSPVRLLDRISIFLLLSLPGTVGARRFYSSSKLEQMDNSSLTVQVRTASGSTLDTLAIVTLCNLSGQTITSKTTFGSQAVFTPINTGQYTVNVEVPGYAKTQAEAQVTSSHGQQILVVTLKPESAAGGETYVPPPASYLP